MTAVLDVLRHERRARWFLLANAQSAIGTGAAYVALVVLAYDRKPSPWAITAVLLADFVPVMLLGPIFGALADRLSRRRCVIAADLLRAAAFVGLGVVDSFAATIGFALAVGVGTALFSPAVLAALPSLADEDRSAGVTALYGVTRDLGRTLGPIAAAIGFPLIGAENLMLVNGATFALSALAIALIPFGEQVGAVGAGGYRRLLSEAREGLTVTWHLPGAATVLWSSTAVILFAAMINVGELLLARAIGASSSQFAILMVGVGVGVVIGSLLAAPRGALRAMKRRYLAGILVLGLSMVALGLVHSFALALIGFFGTGIGNGLVVVHERLIFHAVVPDRLMARAFALMETLGGWGFAAAFVGAGAVISAVGVRTLFWAAGAVGVLTWASAALALRGLWRDPRPSPAARTADPGARTRGEPEPARE